jgi:hypothetical protein
MNQESGIGNAGRPFGRSIYTPATLAEGIPPPPAEGFEPTADQQKAPTYGASGPVAARYAQPSLLALDRENWGTTTVDVPNDFAAHTPRFATNYIDTRSNPRAQGKYPNERTSLGLSTDRHSDEQILEAAAAPFVAAQDVLLLIPRAIMEIRPYRPTRTGSEPYARSPSDVLIVYPSVEVEGPPARIDMLSPRPKANSPMTDPGAAPIPSRSTSSAGPTRPVQPPADDLRPGGGMPASNVRPAKP